MPLGNTGIIITNKDPNNNLSGVQVVLDGNAKGVIYDDVNKVLTVGIDPNGNTTANDVIKLINGSIKMIDGSDYNSPPFYAALDPAGGNDGTGKVVSGTSGDHVWRQVDFYRSIGSSPYYARAQYGRHCLVRESEPIILPAFTLY